MAVVYRELLKLTRRMMSNYATNLEWRPVKFGTFCSVEAIFGLRHDRLALLSFCCLRSLWRHSKRSWKCEMKEDGRIKKKNKDWNVYARKHSLSGAQETFVTSFNGGSCCQQQYHHHHYHHPIFLVANMHLTSIHLSISTSSLYSHSFSCRLRFL